MFGTTNEKAPKQEQRECPVCMGSGRVSHGETLPVRHGGRKCISCKGAGTVNGAPSSKTVH